MAAKRVALAAIVENLDALFEIRTFPPDQPFAPWFAPTYGDSVGRLQDHFEPTFLQSGNGLMVRGSDAVEEINTVVFINDEVIDKALSRPSAAQLLLSHHPLDFETSDRGFLPLSRDRVEALKPRISIYSLHNPLDVHARISTGLAWARQLALREVEYFLEGEAGRPHAVRGQLPGQATLATLLERISGISGVPDLHWVPRRQEISSVAILAGGAVPDSIVDAQRAGVDAIITGTYHNQCNNEFGVAQRDEFTRVEPSLTASVIECSHYASEALVMRYDLLEYAHTAFGLPGEFIPQNDPWH
jgi:putative NIF3 family GTP cyclohydrolase 1 type 2